MGPAARPTGDPVTRRPRAVPWSPEHSLVQRALRSARDFEFFQLLHMIDRIAPELAPIGQRGPAQREGVRLRPALSLGFALADIDSAEWRDRGELGQLVLTTTFLGLYGAESPLATHFTENLLPEQEADIRTRDFLDLFHHRALSLLYRVWVKYRYYVTFRRDGQDPISRVVRGIVGLGTPHLDEALRLNPVRMFRYAGLLAQRPRNAAGLLGMLRDYFPGVDFAIEQCTGRWLRIEDSDCNAFGRRNCTLGQNLLLGERLYDRGGKFRIRVGPVGFDQYVKFLPPGSAAADVRAIARFYCGDPLEFDLEVTLRGDEVPETPIGERGMLGRLAWTSWMRSQPTSDRSVVFAPPEQSVGYGPAAAAAASDAGAAGGTDEPAAAGVS